MKWIRMFYFLQDRGAELLHLFYPELCGSCGAVLMRKEESLCLNCSIRLPKTYYWQIEDNPVYRLFWGRVEIENGAAFCFFEKAGIMQRLIHSLKYKERGDIGEYLGKQMALSMKDAEMFDDVDELVPVPIHRRKKLKRGYNQSELIAIGYAELRNLPVNTRILIRKLDSGSQTGRSRYERYENVLKGFALNALKKDENKHFLLIDDVVTTGATLEVCASLLLKIPGARVSILTAAAPH